MVNNDESPEHEETKDSQNTSADNNTSEENEEEVGGFADKENLLSEGSDKSSLSIPGKRSGKRAGRFLKKHKKSALGGGLVGAAFGLIFFSGGIMNLLGPFKLMHLANNIEDVRGGRMHHTMDQRSDRFVTSMLAAEVAGDTQDGRNRYFQAKGWSSRHPFTQWYRDMKVNNFLDKLETDQGIRFIRESSPNGSDRLVRIQTGRGEINLDKRGVADQDLGRFVNDRYETNQQARRALKQAIRDETRYYQVIKRRNLRRWAMETLGVRKWRFFEGTRDNARNKVRSTWTRMVTKRAQSGSFLRCLFGGKAKCPKTSSLNDPDNHTDPDSGGRRASQATEVIEEGTEEARNTPDMPDSAVKRTGAGKTGRIIAKKMAAKFIPFVNIAEGITALVTIDALLGDGGLVKLIAVSRQAEYATAWTTFQTQTDHMKAGEEVSSEEVNATMEMYEGVEKSEGYQDVFEQQPGSLSPENARGPDSGAVFAQSDGTGDNQDFAEVTQDMQINNTDNNAQKITDFYQSTVGQVLSPLVTLCEGTGICQVAKFVGDVVGFVLSAAGEVLSFVIPDNIEEAGRSLLESIVGAVGEWIFTSLGGAPVCTGEESGGQLFNCIDGGAAVTQEQFLQSVGGSQLSEEEVATLEHNLAEERLHKQKQQSMWKRYASLDNHRSLVSRMLVRMPLTWERVGQRVAGLFNYNPRSVATGTAVSLQNLFGGSGAQVYAEKHTDNLYGVKRYGFTEEELDQPPFGGQSESECNKEKSEFEAAMKSNDEAQMDRSSSICMVDEVVANGMKSMLTEEDDGGIGTAPGVSRTPDTGTPTGDSPQLAEEILSSPNITFAGGESGRVRNSFVQIAEDGEASLYTRNNAETTAVSSNLLGIILQIAEDTEIQINSLTTGDHSSESHHYHGRAVDIDDAGGVAEEIMPFLFENRNSFNLDELIYGHSVVGAQNLDNGTVNVYGQDVLDAHSGHVHVSVQQ